MDRIVSVYGHFRIRFCPCTGKYWSEKVYIEGYFTHCESKELYKILDANSKMVILYKWLLHSVLRICTIQRLPQFKAAWQKHLSFFLVDIYKFIFLQLFSFQWSVSLNFCFFYFFRGEDFQWAANKDIIKI